jgi:hypothetical protein
MIKTADMNSVKSYKGKMKAGVIEAPAFLKRKNKVFY